MAEPMGNPRISNEVLSDQIEALNQQVTRLDAKFDLTVNKFVTREVFDLKMGEFDRELKANMTASIRRQNWIMPAVLYVAGQLFLYFLIKKVAS